MKKITCLIIDDEPMAQDLLEGYVKQTPFLELVAKCSSAIEALEYIYKYNIDVLFLDIQMPDLSGIEFSRTLKAGPKVVFTTAFEQYALQGFQVDALDYLLKPFNYQEFLKAARKAQEWVEMSSQDKVVEENELFVKSDYKIIKVLLNEVIFFEGLKDYVKIHIEGRDHPLLSLMSLKSIEEKVSEKQFMRIHRSFIINLSKLTVIEKGKVFMHGIYIPVADAYKEKFNRYIASRSAGQ